MNSIDHITEIPKDFKEQLQRQLSSEYHELLNSLAEEPVNSIRMHLRRAIDLYVKYSSIPWCNNGYYLYEKPSYTLDPSFHAGCYYVQEASSMVVKYILEYLLPNQRDDIKILDLCASPGGKSTALLDFLDGNGLLVSNEVIKSRVNPLVQNIMKWGYNNAVVSNNGVVVIGDRLPGYFDVILVDAPCSGEGMFRKDHNARSEWSLSNVELCSKRQQRILDDILPALKSGGIILYSTCTFNNSENIEQVQRIHQKYKMSSVKITFPNDFNITEIKQQNAVGYQFFPHKTKGEGFFISVLMKNEGEGSLNPKLIKKTALSTPDKVQSKELSNWLITNNHLRISSNADVYHYNNTLDKEINLLLSQLNVRYSGIKCGQFKKTIFIPHHALALSFNLALKHRDLELSTDQALEFLRKKPIEVSGDKGWRRVTFKGHGIGWLKNIGNRINNYLPDHFKIKHL